MQWDETQLIFFLNICYTISLGALPGLPSLGRCCLCGRYSLCFIKGGDAYTLIIKIVCNSSIASLLAAGYHRCRGCRPRTSLARPSWPCWAKTGGSRHAWRRCPRNSRGRNSALIRPHKGTGTWQISPPAASSSCSGGMSGNPATDNHRLGHNNRSWLTSRPSALAHNNHQIAYTTFGNSALSDWNANFAWGPNCIHGLGCICYSSSTHCLRTVLGGSFSEHFFVSVGSDRRSSPVLFVSALSHSKTALVSQGQSTAPQPHVRRSDHHRCAACSVSSCRSRCQGLLGFLGATDSYGGG